jgi:hypothetical protein
MKKIVIQVVLWACAMCLSLPTNAQRARFDVMTYTVPSGYEVQSTNSTNARSFVKKDRRTGKYSLFVLYPSTSGFGNPDTDFERRWKQLIIDLGRSSGVAQKASTKGIDHTMVTGIGAITHEGEKAAAMLTTVTTQSNRLITILFISNDENAVPDYQAFMAQLDVDGLQNAAATPPNRPPSQNAGTSSSISTSAIPTQARAPQIPSTAAPAAAAPRSYLCSATGTFQAYCSPGTFCPTKFSNGSAISHDLNFARNAAITNCNNNARALGGSTQCIVSSCNDNGK